MHEQVFSGGFWHSDCNHIATNSARADEADGLTEFAKIRGLRGLCFFQTSGSEGLPKWVALRKEAFLISGAAVNAHFEATAKDRWLVALPLHHVGGFAIYARAHLSGSVVIRSEVSKWDPAAFVQECEGQGITLVSLVPAQVHDLVRSRLACPPCLRAAIIGGGGMTQTLADQASALGWRVFQSYGMTEAASQIATQPYNPFGAVFDVTSLEVLPHWQLDLDSEGRLMVKGQALALGYARRETENSWTWDAIDSVAGLRTRDMVRLWQHGTRRFLSFVGRESGTVKILGELVHLAPLQARLEALAVTAGWAQMPVIATVPDQRREAQLVLVTEGESGGEALRESFNAATPPLCHLSRVIPVASIPRTDLGKVSLKALEALLK